MEEARLLVLVPHEPDLDPRVGWVIGLCRTIGRTEVLAATWNSAKPTVEYDGVVSIERVDYARYASRLALAASALTGRLDRTGPVRRFVERGGCLPAGWGVRPRIDHHVGALSRLVAAWGFYWLLISALYRRGRAVAVRPTVIVSHDIYALLPAAVLARRWQAKLLHDSHEYFPESDLLAPAWQKRLIRSLERRFIRRADRVVTVSAPLARTLENVYSLSRVASVPNAEPYRRPREIASRGSGPLRLLLQGQASPGRGFEELLDAWRRLDDPEVVLQVRCPDGEYPQSLRMRYADLVDSCRLEWLEPVGEDDLVDAATRADVGVIPYVGPSLNHLFACPNKLSQYMAAGLAVLASADLLYVRELLEHYRCGLTYAPRTPASLAAAVRAFKEPGRLESLREAAQAATRTFNWEQVSAPYREALEELAR